MMNKYKSIFDNLTDSQFEEILKECGFNFKKVDGEGGLFINGERIYSDELEHEYDVLKNTFKNNENIVYSKKNTIVENNLNSYLNKFEALEEYLLVA